MIKKFFDSLKQKGQVFVLYALLIPLLMLAGGAAVDLGWYYTNKAQLQNAADSAAIAGAKKLQTEKENYINPALIADVPLGSDNINDLSEKEMADEEAKNYLKQNWNVEDKPLVDEEKLFKDGDDNFYYVVELTDNNFKHLFNVVDKIFKPNVISVAKLVYHAPPPQDETPTEVEEELPKLKAENVVSGNWEVEDAKIKGNWKTPTENLDNYFVKNALHTYDNDKVWLNYNNGNDTNYYKAGDYFRYSTVDVKPGNGRLRTGGNSDITTPDSLTLGFRQDIIRILPGALEIKEDGRVGVISKKSAQETIFEKDWDIRYDTPYSRKLEIKYINGKYLSGNGNGTWWTAACDLRIHAIFNISNFEVRKDKISQSSPYDILWVRIESEAFIPLGMFGVTGGKVTSHRQFKSVRQIILNINQDNTEKDSDGNFKYRPVVMFYDGPEKIDMNSHVRDPKPVILNLNKDFRGVLFAPTSSVILNANGHHFYGFIVAKDYRKLSSGIGHKVNHKNSNEMYVNDYGEVYTQRTDEMSCGTYDTFGIVSFEDYDYNLEDHSQNNLFIYSSQN